MSERIDPDTPALCISPELPKMNAFQDVVLLEQAELPRFFSNSSSRLHLALVIFTFFGYTSRRLKGR